LSANSLSVWTEPLHHAQVEVQPFNHCPRAAVPNQHVQKLLRLQRQQTPFGPENDAGRDLQLTQQVQLFREIDQTRRGAFRGKHGHRVRIERNHNARQAALLRDVQHALDNFAMAQMHAVKVADCQRYPAGGGEVLGQRV
jgi:hypothetical protein